jgi:nitrate/TMAO reductase-like tetraheme cytochrome c subunit
MTREEMLNPEYCADCHEQHYREWSGSRHAYSSEGPVFRAIVEYGQRTLDGALGDLCVLCHAPMARLEGATTDGLNLDEVPQHLRGVTCAYCHLVDEVLDDHNNQLRLADDLVMRGGYSDPADNESHASRYSPIHDRNNPESSALCGSCHDVVTPAGVHLERTFAEWRETVFAHDGPGLQTCGSCHMRGRNDTAAESDDEDLDVGLRRVHSHAMPGVDLALTDFPEREFQRLAVQSELDTSLSTELCVNELPGGVEAVVRVENVTAGHSFPSGATQDRRVWVEMIAYQGGVEVYSNGAVADGQPAVDLDDPGMMLFYTQMFDADDQVGHFVWEAARIEENLLLGAQTNDPNDPAFYHFVEQSFVIDGATPDRITLRVRMRPIALELANILVDSGDLDAAHRDALPTFDLASTVLEWTGPLGSCVR